MSSPSDPPPSSDPYKGGIRPMPFFVAAAWVMGATLTFGILSVRSHSLASGFAWQVVAYLLTVFLILRVHAPSASVREFLAIRRTHFAFYPIALALGAALFAPAAELFEFVKRRYAEGPPESPDFDMLTHGSTPRIVLGGLVIIALGPLLEEVLYRGAIWKPLERKHQAGPSIVIGLTAVLFAAAHVNRHAMIHLALVGMVLGLLRRQSGSIIPSTLAHGVYNAITFYFLVKAPSDAVEVEVDIPRWVVAASLCAVALLLGMAYLVSTRTEAASRAQELDRR